MRGTHGTSTTMVDRPPLRLKREVALAINPALFAQSELKFNPDPWQKDVLQTKNKNLILNCTRQAGKSTIASILSLHTAIYKPDSLVLVISPSLRQSSELYKKIANDFKSLKNPPKLEEDTKSSFEVVDGGRVLSLPSSEATIRGFSKVDLVIEDESARVDDELHNAIIPMLAVSNGKMMLLSSAYKEEGHFYRIWSDHKSFPNWKRVLVPATMIPRITPEFLAAQKAAMGTVAFNREFMCIFMKESEHPMFRREWFKIVHDYPKDGKVVRRWDKAATEVKKGKDPDFTAGCKMVMKNGQFWIIDMKHERLSSKGNQDLLEQTAILDTKKTPIRMEKEPGSSGKDVVDFYARTIFLGYDFKGIPSTGSKAERAAPFSAAVEAGNVFLVDTGDWNIEGFISECCAFPEGKHDDRVDAAAGAFNDLAGMAKLGKDIDVSKAVASVKIPSFNGW